MVNAQESTKETVVTLASTNYCLWFIALVAGYYALYFFYWYNLVKPDFTGKHIFITGPSSGIGEQITKRFCQLGAAKIYMAARNEKEMERVKKECQDLMKGQSK
jgi:NADPH:quinone reductase-like Zn-dependent oxidoreductase